MFVPFPEIQSKLSSFFALQLIHNPWAAVGDRVFVSLRLFSCRFFVSCFFCVYSFARCLCSENGFFSQAFFLRRITNSFSCHIQLSLRIAFRPPPLTAGDPWDSPPSRNCPDLFSISEKVCLLCNGFLSVSFVLSLFAYILPDHSSFVNTFLVHLVKFFPEILFGRQVRTGPGSVPGGGKRQVCPFYWSCSSAVSSHRSGMRTG